MKQKTKTSLVFSCFSTSTSSKPGFFHPLSILFPAARCPPLRRVELGQVLRQDPQLPDLLLQVGPGRQRACRVQELLALLETKTKGFVGQKILVDHFVKIQPNEATNSG